MRYAGLLYLAATVALAQPPLTVQNAASYEPGQAAPGSLLVVRNLPVAPTVTIQPASGTSRTPLPLLAGSRVLLPANLPAGPATLQVTSRGRPVSAVSLTIVPSSFGLFTQSSGQGPVLGPTSLTQPAKPGDYITLWGTGLGSATQDQVKVLLGGHAAPVIYAGPAPGYPGTDQINFQVPNDPAIPFGCYVSVSVIAAGVPSNTATLSTSADGSACQNPLGFSAGQEKQLDAGESLNLGQIGVYDMVGPPVNQWFVATGYTRTESAQAIFLEVNAANAAALVEPLQADDAYYSCHSVGELRPALFRIGSFASSPVVTLTSGSKSVTFTGQDQIPTSRLVATPDGVAAPFFSAGEWTAALFSAQGELSVPQPVHITNESALATINRSGDLTIGWNGGDYTASYTAILLLNSASALICRAPGNAGTLTVPSALLQTLTPQAGSLELLLEARTGSFTIFPVPLTGGESMPVLFRYFTSEVIPIVIQ